MLSCSPVCFLWNAVKFIDAKLVDLLSKSGTAKIMWFIYGDVFLFLHIAESLSVGMECKNPKKKHIV